MSKKIKCLIVDDEPPAIRLLEKYVAKVAFLELVTTTTNSLEALQIIENQNIDLVFLDIQMPNLTGIQLSKIVKGKVKIIFTTAYPQFALESYDLDAVDYLLKPFEFERFYQAVLKVKSDDKIVIEKSKISEFIFIKTGNKNSFEKVYINDICYVESLKNYVAIHLKDKQIITYNTLKHIEEYLGKNDFVKTHKSFIIAINHIDKTTTDSVFIGKNELPIGDTYKKSFFELINNRKL
jgi:DNA-binding LytR/AlgR family response regulator